MKKRHLRTIEEVLALKDTDTKIYTEDTNGYYQFVKGTLCYFYDDGSMAIYSEIGIGKGFAGKYIVIEEEANENDLGKLCWFWDKDEKYKRVGILDHIENNLYYMKSWFCEHCRRLTPEEVAEITGYKVEGKDD